MKTGSDTYNQCKQEHYDQDVMKSYSGYICHTPARKIPRLTASPLSYRIPPLLMIRPTVQQFSHPPFPGIFGKVSPKGHFKLCSPPPPPPSKPPAAFYTPMTCGQTFGLSFSIPSIPFQIEWQHEYGLLPLQNAFLFDLSSKVQN